MCVLKPSSGVEETADGNLAAEGGVMRWTLSRLSTQKSAESIFEFAEFLVRARCCSRYGGAVRPRLIVMLESHSDLTRLRQKRSVAGVVV